MKKIIVILIIVAVFVGFYFFELGQYLNFDTLKESQVQLNQFYSENMLLTILLFAIIYIVSTAVSIPGATILTLSSGVIFGSVLGTLVVILSATIGSTLAMLFSRFLLRDWIQDKFSKQFKLLNPKIESGGFNYLLFLRLVPLFPFFVINLVCGITNLKVRTFFFASLIGMLPGSFVYTNAGSQIASINSPAEIISARVLIAFALLGCLSLVPLIIKKIKGAIK
jgi:uncharacterized membrane protein YdjX (TVP38/TMEM64 family)